MRDDIDAFKASNATIAVVVHDDNKSVAEYWGKHRIPYVGIPDPKGVLAKRYGQQWKLLRAGRMPALFVIDADQQIVAEQRGDSMKDIPRNADVLELLQGL